MGRLPASSWDKLHRLLIRSQITLLAFHEDTPKKGDLRLRLECPRHHVWNAAAKAILTGDTIQCAVCNRYETIKRDTYERLKCRVAERGGRIWVDSLPHGIRTRIEVECDRGHRWETRVARLLKGAWCALCAHERLRLTLEDMQISARKKGGECLSTSYSGINEKLRWRCGQGHEWEGTAINVRHQSWCPTCSHHRRRTIEEMKELAQSRGGCCLSSSYRNGKTHLKWECSKRHRWRASADSIVKGTWCPKCSFARRRRPGYTIEEMRALATQRGGKCHSDTYINNHTPLLWECENGHLFRSRPMTVLQGSWCRTCFYLHLR